MNRHELTDMILDSKKVLSFYEGIHTGCAMCEHFIRDARTCKKHGPVPHDFVEQGCDEWEWDDVPF